MEIAVLRYWPFMTLNGNSLRYNREATPGNIDFYGIGDAWNESVMTVSDGRGKQSPALMGRCGGQS
jgi:hypothetical protein